ncbi:hypothetical protein DPX16_13401 [Anabarilius grahami]|uniref:Uncharacterized protein n=1 Tax=Anabarilius grahami TaxID=495550 RepID=A0A3N0YNA3_ANAGA|nr:hypothetical protein DPX16_13401 [Anabarilius grahami]
MKLVISGYISSFLLCKAQYRPRYKTDGKRGGKQDEDERKEAGVKAHHSSHRDRASVGVLTGAFLLEVRAVSSLGPPGYPQASTFIQYGLQALDTAQLPDSDEHILISYKSSAHREEPLKRGRKKARKRKGGRKEGRKEERKEKERRGIKAWEMDTKRTKCSANVTSFRST